MRVPKPAAMSIAFLMGTGLEDVLMFVMSLLIGL